MLLVLLPRAVAAQDASRLSNVALPPQVERVPDRPRPLFELGDPFLGSGPLNEAFVLPTGAALQPSFLVFGTFRSALQTFDDGGEVTTEWASRLDLFGNLQLSGTERLLVGLRPLDDDGRFTRYRFEPGPGEFEGELDLELSTLFFEGDLGELLPGLDERDTGRLDWGFAVGRQQLTFQDGLLVDDRIDALGVTRNTLLPAGTSNLRVTALVGWDEVHRDDNREDEDALLVGVFSEADLPRSTVSLDVVYVHDDDDDDGVDTDALYAGAGAVQRLGHWNTTFRALASHPVHAESPAASRGQLLFAELSRTPTASDDLVYANAFWGIERFSSAARGPERGGPLGRAGILFAAVGLGSYGAPLGNDPDASIGAALGWQTFLGGDDRRRQLVLEVGGRVDTDASNREAVAGGFRYQQAAGRHAVWSLDGFVAGLDDAGPRSGLRAELALKW